MTRYLIILLLIIITSGSVYSQTTAFTYQGSLKDGATAANGNYDFEFALFDAVSGGSQLGATLSRNTVAVANGIFSVSLDFGGQFPGSSRFLEIRVRLSGQPGITTLGPRQPVNSAPYSVKSLNADSAANAATATDSTQLGGVAAKQYVVTGDPRLSDARAPTAGSPNYIQNTTVQQASSDFSIAGSGTAGGTLSGSIVNADTQYNVGGSRVLAIPGVNNIFAGFGAGTANTTGTYNSFVGSGAGNSNTTGGGNTFVGADAGFNNTTGSSNLAVGWYAGLHNTTGAGNSFVGTYAGHDNTTGASNSFFGLLAGDSNTTGSNNSYFGPSAGTNSRTGYNNSFFGANAGISNLTGFNNSFFGMSAGASNTTDGTNVTIIGAGADTAPGASNLNNATAIGANAHVSQSDSLVLGDTGVNVGISTTAPQARLNVVGTSWFQGDTTPLSTNAGKGVAVGSPSGSGAGYLFSYDYSANAPQNLAINGPGGNVGVGTISPTQVLDVNGRARVRSMPLLASLGQVCFNGAGDLLQCGASSLKWKTNVQSYRSGLDVIRRLRPISFNWKEDGRPDIGLGAEDVAKVAPSFAYTNSKGEVEGVKYERLNILLINAVNEQQSQIDEQKKTIDSQQTDINELKQIVCELKPTAKGCSPK